MFLLKKLTQYWRCCRIEDQVFVSIAEEAMTQKNYNPMLSIVASQTGRIENTYRIIKKEEFFAILKQKLKLSKYKAKKLMQVYLDLNFVSEEGDYYKFNPIQKYFVKVTLQTAIYFLDNLSDYSFKIYCWLLNKYENHLRMVQKYQSVENYFFSVTQIIEAMGYSKTSVIWSRTVEALNTLEQLEYIKYNHERVGRPGHHGTYHELFWVHQYGKAHIKATEDIIDKYGEEIIPESVAARLVTSDRNELKQIESQYDEFNKRLQAKNGGM